ncbi:MAG: serine/threonine-protein kinase [Gemmatimonadales bacterium]
MSLAPLPQVLASLADRYVVERELGRGGMATVYLARDLRHDRLVALKLLHPELAQALGPERFVREIKLAARLQHPHILPLFDSGTAGGMPYYAMPYVEGESLRARMARERQLGLEDALRITREVAAALDHAHTQGIVHRDIKPENVLLTRDGSALVADFGIARAVDAASGEKLTETGLALGTPAYMSPEQAAGDGGLDGRGDIYALGCVCYEMLAGQPPFTGPTAQAILARHSVDPVPSLRTVRSTVPEAVERAITKALAKVPADRFATAGEFVQALGGTAGMAGPVRSGSRVRSRSLVLGAAAVILALAIGRMIMRRPPGTATPDPKLVAILPFRIAGANPELGWLREGLIDLLAIKLTGEGGLRAAEPRAVLSAWNRVAGAEGQEITPAAALEIARRLGAGRVIDGGVVGTSGHLTLTASLLTAPGGRSVARASVEGRADSLPALVDGLAVRLLSLEAGTESSRLPSLTTRSLPAIRAYLAGRAAFRRGRLDEAFNRFREATHLDSTFALAALELVHVSIWKPPGLGGEDAQRGMRLVRAGRARLSPGDQALLDDWTGPTPTGPELFARRLAVAKAYPDRAETWSWLGDGYFHYGMSAGLEDPLRLADEAFQRGWAIDSAGAGDSLAPERSPISAEPLIHMVEIAQLKGDTASVRRLVALGLAADSTSTWDLYLRWNRAVALGDSARRAFWADSERIERGESAQITGTMEWTGAALPGSQRYLRAVDEDNIRAANLAIRHDEVSNPTAAVFGRGVNALNGGRPRAAREFRNTVDTSTVDLRGRILDALYWGADTSAAAEAARRLATRSDGAGVTGDEARTGLANLCVLATWRVANGDYHYAEAAIRRLRGVRAAGLSSNDIALTQYADVCAALLAATRATALRLPGARATLEQADAAARTYIFVVSLAPNLVVARLAEIQGDVPLALRAVRRRAGGYGIFPWYFSTFLREEGRLAALAGDTAGAIRAYQHYLALRPTPEPEVRPEVDRVREDLARLLGEHHGP